MSIFILWASSFWGVFTINIFGNSANGGYMYNVHASECFLWNHNFYGMWLNILFWCVPLVHNLNISSTNCETQSHSVLLNCFILKSPQNYHIPLNFIINLNFKNLKSTKIWLLQILWNACFHIY